MRILWVNSVNKVLTYSKSKLFSIIYQKTRPFCYQTYQWFFKILKEAYLTNISVNKDIHIV